MYPVRPGGMPGASRRPGGAPAAWKAGIVVILTPGEPAMDTVRVPPRIVPTQGEVRGTFISLPRPVAGQAAGAAPVISRIFCVKKLAISPPTITAELCRAAISGALPWAG